MSTGWAPCYVFFLFAKRSIIDGRLIHGHVMRRRVNGQWQYRPLSDDEMFEKVSSEAW
jgi:hypothetical protein